MYVMIAALSQRPQRRIGMALIASGRAEAGAGGPTLAAGTPKSVWLADPTSVTALRRGACRRACGVGWARVDCGRLDRNEAPRGDDLLVRAVVDQGLQRLLDGVDELRVLGGDSDTVHLRGVGRRRVADHLEGVAVVGRRCDVCGRREVGQVSDGPVALDGEERRRLVRKREDLHRRLAGALELLVQVRQERLLRRAVLAGDRLSGQAVEVRDPLRIALEDQDAGAVEGVVDEAEAGLLTLGVVVHARYHDVALAALDCQQASVERAVDELDRDADLLAERLRDVVVEAGRVRARRRIEVLPRRVRDITQALDRAGALDVARQHRLERGVCLDRREIRGCPGAGGAAAAAARVGLALVDELLLPQPATASPR